jgi:hypothetical protein
MKNSEISKRVVRDKNNFTVRPLNSKYSVMGANQMLRNKWLSVGAGTE